VYGSVGGALNNVVNRPVWETVSLREEFKRRGGGQPTFDAVIPVAIEPVVSEVEFVIPRDRIKNSASDEYLDMLKTWVLEGGIAVVSMELSSTAPPDIRRIGRYHMITLIERIEGGYRVWDTNRMAGCIADSELQTGFLYPDLTLDGVYYSSPYMVIHPEKDCILFRKRKL